MSKHTKSMTHNLQSVSPHYDNIKDGLKNFEICFDDRDFSVGDLLILQENRYNRKGKPNPTGEFLTREVKFILRKAKGLQFGYVVLGLQRKQ